jgi:hypothetical protein
MQQFFPYINRPDRAALLYQQSPFNLKDLEEVRILSSKKYTASSFPQFIKDLNLEVEYNNETGLEISEYDNIMKNNSEWIERRGVLYIMLEVAERYLPATESYAVSIDDTGEELEFYLFHIQTEMPEKRGYIMKDGIRYRGNAAKKVYVASIKIALSTENESASEAEDSLSELLNGPQVFDWTFAESTEEIEINTMGYDGDLEKYLPPALKHEIFVTIINGRIQDITGIPEDIIVKVIDHDTEGAEPEEYENLPEFDGKKAYVTTYTKSDEYGTEYGTERTQ